MSATLFGVEPESTAVLSPDGLYRYRLTRSDLPLGWLRMHEPCLLWIMLNPSTADAAIDDPTIRRVKAFTQRLGYSGLTVVNLYALRSTDPRGLWTADDPVGPDNDSVIAREAFTAVVDGAPIIAAWGANARPERVAEVLALPHVAARLHCLGVTKFGAPRHPLYLRSDAALRPWPVQS
jgi:hypothetical protein